MSLDMPPALPDGYVCPEGSVPGWLNGEGLPTACVGDAAVPGEVFPPALPLNPLPDVLAATGSDVVLLAWACVALAVMCGLLAVVSFRLSPRIKRKGI